jgi:hypothetical protein
MAFSATTTWEVRTTGNANNGGGFAASPYLAAPSAPSLAMGGNGTVAVDVYYCVICYNNGLGNGKCSGETSLDVNSTSTDTIVVTSPAASNGAANYRVFIGTVSGGPYFLQGTTTAVGTNVTLSSTPATSGAQPFHTDRSQADAAYDSGTDLACADGDLEAPVISSATHNFLPEDVGNFISITAGTGYTVGRYQIVSVDGSNNATLDKACGTDGAKTDGTWYLGGAVASPSTLAAIVVAGNTAYIKNGTYTETLTIAVAGSLINPIYWIGYNSSRTDKPMDSNRPTISGSTYCISIPNAKHSNCFMYMQLTGSSTAAVNIAYDQSVAMFYGVKIYSNTGKGVSMNNQASFFYCEISGNTDIGIHCNQYFTATIVNCYIHDNTDYGISSRDGSNSSIGCAIIRTVVESNSKTGLEMGGADGAGINAQNCVFHNNTGASSDGINCLSDNGSGRLCCAANIYNCIFTNNGRFGLNANYDSALLVKDYNCFNGNSTAARGPGISVGANDVTADPLFTDAANGDFTLQAGSPCLNVGSPQTPMAGATI